MRSIRYDLLLRTLRDLSVCLSVCLCLSIGHNHELCKNGWTDRDAVWSADSDGPKEPCIRWGGIVKYGEYAACGWYCQPYSVGGSSNAASGYQFTAAACLYVSKLLRIWVLSTRVRGPHLSAMEYGWWKRWGECFRIVVAGRNSSSLCRLCVCSPRTAVVAS